MQESIEKIKEKLITLWETPQGQQRLFLGTACILISLFALGVIIANFWPAGTRSAAPRDKAWYCPDTGETIEMDVKPFELSPQPNPSTGKPCYLWHTRVCWSCKHKNHIYVVRYSAEAKKQMVEYQKQMEETRKKYAKKKGKAIPPGSPDMMMGHMMPPMMMDMEIGIVNKDTRKIEWYRYDNPEFPKLFRNLKCESCQEFLSKRRAKKGKKKRK